MRYITEIEPISDRKKDRFKSWRKNKIYDFFDNRRSNLVKILFIILFILVSLIISSNLSAQPSNMPGAKLNESQTFGSLGKTVKLTKAVTDDKSNTTLLYLSFSNGSDTKNDVINWGNINFDFKGDNWLQENPKTKIDFIPTSYNTGVIKAQNIKHKYKDFQIILSDKQIDASKISAASSDSTKTDSSEIPEGKFVINRDTPKKFSIKKSVNQQDLAIEENMVEQKDIDKLIDNNKRAIKALDSSDRQIHEDIEALNNQKKVTTDSEEMESIDNQISTKQGTLNDSSTKKSQLKEDIQDQKETKQSLIKQAKKLHKGQINLSKVMHF